MTAGTCVKLKSNWLDSLIIQGAEDPREGRHSQLCSPPSPARKREIPHDLNTTEFYQWARKQQREVADTQSVHEGQRCPHNWFYRWKENTWVERQQSFNILFLSAQQKSRLEKKVGKKPTKQGCSPLRSGLGHTGIYCGVADGRKKTRRQRCLHGNKCNGNISTGSVAEWHWDARNLSEVMLRCHPTDPRG